MRFEDPQKQFDQFLKIYHSFVQGKFSRGIFTYLSSYIMLANQNEDLSMEYIQEKAMNLYEGMSNNHPFLTSSSDYPLAVLLAHSEEEVEKLLGKMESFYSKLAEKGFRKGNDLQFLSHFLSFKENEDKNVLLDTCAELSEEFKRFGKKLKTQHYASLGVLSLLDKGKNNIETIMKVYEQLNAEKDFKWYKDENLTMAVNLTVSEQFEHTNLLEAGIYTSLETIMQVQQVAMVASLAGAAAVASSGDGG